MERLKTRMWRGGLAEILASSPETASPPLDATRILSAQEMAELCQVHTQVERPSMQALELTLRGRRPWRRLATAAGVVLLAVGGWCATRAGATGAGAVVKPRPVVAAPRMTVTQLPVAPVAVPAPAQPVSAPSPGAGPAVRPRQAVDALAAGDRAQAERLYRQLAAHAVPSAAYARAAEILKVH